jgi:hypothetical protein
LHSTKCVVVALVMRVRYVSKCCRPAFPVCINSAGLPIDRKARCLAHGYHQKSPGTLRTESLSSLLHGKMEELRMNSLESRIAILVQTRLGLSALHALYAKFPELTAPSPGSQLRCSLHPSAVFYKRTYCIVLSCTRLEKSWKCLRTVYCC